MSDRVSLRTYWDSQLRFSAILPGFEAALERMSAESACVGESAPLERRDYGDHPRQWVEWAIGDGFPDVLPVIVHGGYWRALRAEDHRFLIPHLRSLGASVANIEYRLMPDVRLGQVVADVAAALHCLSEVHPRAQFLLIGHSAGAHLALSAIADLTIAGRTRGIIALSGVYDLAPLPHSFLQDEIGLTLDEVRDHSLGPSGSRPPVLYVNGSAETHEFLRGSAVMASHGRSGWHVIDGADHMTLLWAAASVSGDLATKLFAL